jgi:hypothetical protein
MQKPGNNTTLEREKALAVGMREVASELRLVDATDFVAFIRTGQFANVGSLVSSSTELFFKPGTVRFGSSGDIDLKWGRAPAITLDMEFRHMRVNVHFRLLLEALEAGVEIDYITFEGASADADENTRRLVTAIADARLVPGRSSSSRSPAAHTP